MSVLISLCDGCKHRTSDERCEAFPSGIPDRFLVGPDLHTEPSDGDGGIVFKARDATWAAIARDVIRITAEPPTEGDGEEQP